jgi:transcriptional regulator with XRE-family HTH domain
MSVGRRIKDRRKELKMSAEELADIIGVSPATIYRYENGSIANMGTDKLDVIAQALSIEPKYLMGWDVEPNTSRHTSENTNKSTGISTTGSVSELSYKAMDIARFYDELPRDAQEFIDQAFKLVKWYIEK